MAQFDPKRHCGAKTRAGQKCRRPKGWGTSHSAPGHGRCKLHGGSTRSHRAAALREAAAEAVSTYGLAVEIDPLQALLEEVYRTAGHVAWLGKVVAELESDHITHGITKTVALPDGTRRVEASAAVSVWVRLYQAERAHLVKVAKAAVDAGIEERLVHIAEAQAMTLVAIVRAIVVDLGHDPEADDVRKVVRLRLSEGGTAA